jgi:hypothetical protein
MIPAWLTVNTSELLGYDGFAFLEGSYRSDRSSTLPKLTTDYFSVSGSLVFSQLVDAPSFGKSRQITLKLVVPDLTMYFNTLILELI